MKRARHSAAFVMGGGFGLFLIIAGVGFISTQNRPAVVAGGLICLSGVVLVRLVLTSARQENGKASAVELGADPEEVRHHPDSGAAVATARQARNKRAGWFSTLSRVLSLLIALGYVVALIVREGALVPWVFYAAAILIFPLAMIWYPDVLGKAKGYWAGGSMGSPSYIDEETPAFMVALAGWFFLVGLPVILYLIWYT